MEAFTGRFSHHHAFLLQTMLGRIDQAGADIAAVQAKIQEQIAPFQAAADRLDEICGVGRAAAQVLIAELGVDMSRFPTPGHLVSWARYAPGGKQSAGKKKGNATTGRGNPYLARVLGEAAVAAGRTNTFPGERYRRIARRQAGRRRGRPLDPDHRLAPASGPRRPLPRSGPGFYDTRINADRNKRNHIRQLEALGYTLTLQPAA